MKIAFADVEFPSQIITNSMIKDHIRENSKKNFVGDFDNLLKKVDFLFDLSGARQRRWIQSSKEQENLTWQLLERVRRKGVLPLNKKGLIISASVDRIMSEPGDSYFYARMLGMESVDCFDILDACNSHLRAWNLARNLLSNKVYDWILVISSEFRCGHELNEGFHEERFRFQNASELQWRFPSLTLGDAVALSLLTHDPNDPPIIMESLSKTSAAPLCFGHLGDLRTFESIVRSPFFHGEEMDMKSEAMKFVCWYSDLELESIPSVVKVWEKLRKQTGIDKPGSQEWVITHSSNFSGWDGAAKWAGFYDEKHINLYPDFGNIINCSIPAALARSASEKFKSNDFINIWTGAAGASYCAMRFPYLPWEN